MAVMNMVLNMIWYGMLAGPTQKSTKGEIGSERYDFVKQPIIQNETKGSIFSGLVWKHPQGRAKVKLLSHHPSREHVQTTRYCAPT